MVYLTQFLQWELSETIQKALIKNQFVSATEIQQLAIPKLLAGVDLLGIAQTGTGKTAAFALPMIQRLSTPKLKAKPARMRALVLAPTRELAHQIEETFKTFGKSSLLKIFSIYGGVGHCPQIAAMAKGLDVLVATPGRLLDLIKQGHIFFDQLEVFVLDEADKMLDMGFIHDVQKIIDLLPVKKQGLLFSATMNEAVIKLANNFLTNPTMINIAPQGTIADKVVHTLLPVEKSHKPQLLKELMKKKSFRKVLVFSRTKHGADRIVRHLQKEEISAAAIHGNKSQGARDRAIKYFKRDKIRVLVATDIAARGIDIPGISHVINYDLPNEAENYIHRIGRTARAEKSGKALSFYDLSEFEKLQAIENALAQKIAIDTTHPLYGVPAVWQKIKK